MELKDIPKDLKLSWEREFSILNCSFLAKQFTNDLEKHIGKGLSFCLFSFNGNKVSLYRSEKEEKEFSKFVGEKCLDGYYKEISAKLKKLTDDVLEFIKGKLNKENVHEFIELYDQLLPYHLAVYWAGDYLFDVNKEIVKVLNEAWKYNEFVYLKVDEWLKKQEMGYLDRDELLEYLLKKVLPNENRLIERENNACIISTNKEYLFCEGDSAKKWQDYIKKQDFSDTDVIKGITASSGKFTGKVRIINKLDELSKVKEDDVIVISMTSPKFNQYIKKCSAIVTDEGGALCHAATVSREFKIPCIIGTKIATKVLKDGDEVEVDAVNGVVRKIS